MSDDIKELDDKIDDKATEVIEETAEEVAEEVKEVTEDKVEEIKEDVKEVEEDKEESASQYAGDKAVEVEAPAVVEVKSQIPETSASVAPATVAALTAEQSKAAIKKEKADAKARKKAEAKQAKKAKKKAELEARVNACPKEYKPLSTAKCFWLFFFSIIPVIGILFSIIMSIVPYNKNIKSMERGILLHHAMWIILILIAALIIFIALGGDAVVDIVKAFGKFFEQLAFSFGA